MNRITRQFVNLILEDEEKEDKPKSETESEKRQRKKKEKNDASEESSSTEERKILKVSTDNSLSKGRPISDPGLANMKYRSNGTPVEAKEMLDELGISSASGKNWDSSISAIFNSAKSGDMGALIDAAELVKSPSDKPGVELKLKSVWKQDDKGGKRSFGFIRAILAASNKAGYLSADVTEIKNLRVEQVDGQDSFLIYVSRKAKNWDY